jgi:predicted small lipoprotein YifL
MSLARSALALAVLLTMLGSAAGCGRKAMPEPRKSESSSTPTLYAAR